MEDDALQRAAERIAESRSGRFESVRAGSPSPPALAAWKTIPQGAATQLWAATAPELEGRGALYLEDCQVSGPEPCPGGLGCERYALDPEAAARLWSLSEDLVGERLLAS